jgi:hypothetical protein
MPQDEVSCTSAVREREVRQLMGAIRFLRTADWQSSMLGRFLNPEAPARLTADSSTPSGGSGPGRLRSTRPSWGGPAMFSSPTSQIEPPSNRRWQHHRTSLPRLTIPGCSR